MKPTEQFSQEYIAFILSDKAKALQEKPDRGQWVWCHHLRVIALVTGVGCDGSQTTEGYLYDDETALLPTLWDLLQIIVGKIRPPEDEVAEMASVLEWIADEALVKAKPIMFTAAKLAVRALSNHE